MALAAAAVCLGLLAVRAQEAPPAEEPPAEPPAESEEAPAPPVSDDIFIPSEEVQADEELVFPIDI